jgi:hypothetical protein
VLGSPASETPLYDVTVTESNQLSHDVLLQFDCSPQHPPRVIQGIEKMHKILTVRLLCIRHDSRMKTRYRGSFQTEVLCADSENIGFLPNRSSTGLKCCMFMNSENAAGCRARCLK